MIVVGCATAILSTAKPAHAVTVTIGGLTYDIQTQTSGQSYDDLKPTLEAAPWWSADGSTGALATEFANAYLSAVGSAAAPTFFAYGPVTNQFGLSYGNCTGFLCYLFQSAAPAILVNDADVRPIRVGAGSVQSGTYPNFVYATAQQVPEIDGPVLARTAMALGALWLGLIGLRRRRGEVAEA